MSKKHTAIIFLHGIGAPQRHASVSNFLDYFDRYGQTQSKEQSGKPRGFKYVTEVSAAETFETTSFVELKRIMEADGNPRVDKKIRVYEGYWVPAAHSRANIFSILIWIFTRLLHAFSVLRGSWRSYPAIKTNILFKDFLGSKRPRTVQFLEELYRDFEKWDARRRYPDGTFRDFYSFLTLDPRATRNPEILGAAKEWKQHVLRTLLWSTLKMFLSSMLLFLAICACVISIFVIFDGLLRSNEIFHSDFIDLSLAAVCVVGLVSIVFSWGNWSKYILDIINWTMQSEENAEFKTRENVVEYVQGLLKHVVSNTDCDRCVIVSHSLGSSIAVEATLRLGGVIKASKLQGISVGLGISDLDKVSYIFTLGSPIEHIFNRFQADRSISHRYNRISEEKRLSISLPPFWNVDKKGQTKIINFWSQFDPISAPIFSLRKSANERKDAVVNVETLPSGFPHPVASHTSYYANKTVIGAIYQSVMTGDLPEFEVHQQRKSSWGFWATSLSLLFLIFLNLVLMGILSSISIVIFMILITPIAVWIHCFLKRKTIAHQSNGQDMFLENHS
ncbi:hypothetical protein [Pseudovibrio sp. WM33]|uniref:hypothetical protein n=1 Tax=Pseudovibrio sp. WM33 TaxID=1735585 RepID=UPI0007AE87B9|nr:hypothetical protein [Pseudovibrio sp. WM33]KZL24703.1 hypothetical protein PsWM33_02377 [Pseudovibrio sp. WM33]